MTKINLLNYIYTRSTMDDYYVFMGAVCCVSSENIILEYMYCVYIYVSVLFLTSNSKLTFLLTFNHSTARQIEHTHYFKHPIDIQ